MLTALLLLTLPLLASSAPAAALLRRDKVEEERAMLSLALYIHVGAESQKPEAKDQCIVGVGGGATMGYLLAGGPDHNNNVTTSLTRTSNPDDWYYTYGSNYTLGQYQGYISFDVVANSHYISRVDNKVSKNGTQPTSKHCTLQVAFPGSGDISVAICRFPCPKD